MIGYFSGGIKAVQLAKQLPRLKTVNADASLSYSKGKKMAKHSREDSYYQFI